MIRHLRQDDFTTMPWANGRGSTVEMLRVDRDGKLLWRLSRASVIEDGPFSVFTGIDRSLTVITGAGFDLQGDAVHLQARPMVPVAFPGDVPISAVGVTGPCEDFNVMVARGLVVAQVDVVTSCEKSAAGGTIAVCAIAPSVVQGIALAVYEVIVTDEPVVVSGLAIVVRVLSIETAMANLT